MVDKDEDSVVVGYLDNAILCVQKVALGMAYGFMFYHAGLDKSEIKLAKDNAKLIAPVMKKVDTILYATADGSEQRTEWSNDELTIMDAALHLAYDKTSDTTYYIIANELHKAVLGYDRALFDGMEEPPELVPETGALIH